MSFFWDTILLGSRHAQWFYEHGFATPFVPDALDAGHPPLLGMYLAMCWRLFGRSLLVSHLAMLPFVAGIVYQLWQRVGQRFSPENRRWAMAMVCACAPLLAHCVLVSPDVLLLWLFLGALNATEMCRWRWQMLYLLLLPLCSLRGGIVVAGLGLYELFLYKKITSIGKYTLALLPLMGYLAWHYAAKGWVLSYEGSPWATQRGFVSAAGLAKNIAVMGFHFVNFGAIGLWLSLAIIGGKWMRSAAAWRMFLPFAAITAVYALALLPFSNPIGPRYMLPSLVLLSLGVAECILRYAPTPRRKQFAIGATVVLAISGHCWVYPQPIANGWDCTLAHLPYYSLRQQAIQYLDAHHIPLDAVGSAFPNLAPLSAIDLTDDTRHFAPKNLEQQRYVLWSNIFNDFSTEELLELRQNWQQEHHWSRGQVEIMLYKK